jgi:hypothetical protein
LPTEGLISNNDFSEMRFLVGSFWNTSRFYGN